MKDEIAVSAKADLAASPAAIWSFLADTERLNRALGLSPVSFVPLPDPAAKGRYRAETRLLGLTLRYDELPFDWVEGRFYEVERRFDSGPLERVVAGVRMEPKGTGTSMEAFARVRPRGWLGALAARSLLEKKAAKDMLALVQGFEREGGVPPLAKPKPGEVDLGALDRRLAGLPDAAPLRKRLAEGSDLEVLRMRPFELADEWGADREAALSLCLRAAKAGALDLVWAVVCPHCRVSARDARSLAEVKRQARCDTCGVDFAADLASTMEARFTANAAIRPARAQTYCIGGPANMPGQLAQLRVPPGERREALPAGTGRVRVRSYSAKGIVSLPYGGLRVTLEGGELRAESAAGSGIVVLNRLPAEALVVVERESWSERAATAARVAALQEFRDLFPGEAVTPGEELQIASLALLFTDLKGSTELYEKLGDGRAFELVQGHFRYLVDRVARHRGGVVKTMGDAIMAAFPTGADAAKAAREMQEGWEAFRKGKEAPEGVLLKVGAHQGPAIAIRNDGRLDYFGTTVNTAARAQGMAGGGEIVLTRALADDPGARLALEGLRREDFQAELKGLAGVQDLVRLAFPE